MKDFIRANILAVSPGSRKQSQSRQTPTTQSRQTPTTQSWQTPTTQSRQTTSITRPVQSKGVHHLRPFTPRITVRSPSTPSAEHGAVEAVRKKLDQVEKELEATRKENYNQVKKMKKKVEQLEVDKKNLQLKFKKSENENKKLKEKVEKLEKDKCEIEVKVDMLEDGRKEMMERIVSLERLFKGSPSSQAEVSRKSEEAMKGPGTCRGCKSNFKRLDLHKKRTKNQHCKMSA